MKTILYNFKVHNHGNGINHLLNQSKGATLFTGEPKGGGGSLRIKRRPFLPQRSEGVPFYVKIKGGDPFYVKIKGGDPFYVKIKGGPFSPADQRGGTLFTRGPKRFIMVHNRQKVKGNPFRRFHVQFLKSQKKASFDFKKGL